jgi:hypothetical protein
MAVSQGEDRASQSADRPENGHFDVRYRQMFYQYEAPADSPEVLWQRKALEEGRGRAHGAEFKPLFRVQRGDFSSHGVSQTAPNPRLRRRHHLLSQMEFAITLLLMHLGALDLREQYRLSLYDDDDEFTSECSFHPGTVSLAKILGIRHPAVNSTEPRLQSTDFVVQDRHGFQRAIFVRPWKDLPLQGSRQMQLLDLQNLYWQVRDVPFHMLTDRDVDPKLIEVLIWAYAGYLETDGQISDDFIGFIADRNGHDPLLRALAGWPAGAGDAVTQFKAAVFGGRINVGLHFKKLPNLNAPWHFSAHVPNHVYRHRLSAFFGMKEARHV